MTFLVTFYQSLSPEIMMCRVLFLALIVALATAFNAGRMGKKLTKNECLMTIPK